MKVKLNHFYKDQGWPGQTIDLPDEEAAAVVKSGGGYIVKEPQIAEATPDGTEPDVVETADANPPPDAETAEATPGKAARGAKRSK